MVISLHAYLLYTLKLPEKIYMLFNMMEMEV